MRHEAEYYGITPLVKRLMLCEDLTQSSCGDVLFYGYLPPPSKINHPSLIKKNIYKMQLYLDFIYYNWKGIPLQEPTTVASNVGDVSVHGRSPANNTNSRADVPSTSQTTTPGTSNSHNNNGTKHIFINFIYLLITANI